MYVYTVSTLFVIDKFSKKKGLETIFLYNVHDFNMAIVSKQEDIF